MLYYKIKEHIPRFWRGIIFLFLLLVLKNESVLGQDDDIFYSADSIVLLVDSNIVRLFGSAKVVTGDIELTAPRIVYYSERKEVCAYGTRDTLGNWLQRPVFSQGGSSFKQDELCYNFKTGKGFSRNAVTQEGELIFHAEESKRQPDNQLHIRRGKFTTCDAENPHFHFYLSKAILYPNDKIISGPLYLKFRKIPTPLALPFAWFPLKQEKRSQGLLLPSYGDGSRLGFFLKNLGYYMPLGDHWDTRVLFDVYTGGSWAVRNVSQYKYKYRSSGNFKINYNKRVTSFQGMSDYGAENNFFVQWSHTQDSKARPNQSFSASLNFGSTDIFQENLNSSMEEYLSNTFQSSVQWSYTSPRSPFSLTTSARHTQNSLTGKVSLTLPSAVLTMSRQSVSEVLGITKGRAKMLDGITLSYNSRFENVAEISDSALTVLDFGAMDIKSGLKHSVTASSSGSLGFVTFAPSFQYDEFTGFNQLDHSLILDNEGQVLEMSDTIPGFVTARNWRAAVSANTRFYGMFSFGENSRIPIIRHVLSPSVSLSYTPERNSLRSESLNDESIEWNPWELNRFAPSYTREAGSLNFALGQNLEAKVRDSESGELRKVKIIDTFTSSASYNFLADSINLSDITSNGFTNLFNRYNINFNMTHSAYTRDSSGAVVSRYLVEEGLGLIRLKRATASVGTSFNGGATSVYPWNVNLNYTMNLSRNWDTEILGDTTAITHGIAVNGGVNLFTKWDVDFQTGYDLVRRELTPTAINLHWDLHCWELTFNWIPFGTRQSFALKINIKSSILKDIKFEARGGNGTLLF